MDDLTRLAMAAQQGDREALATLVRRTQPDVWRFCAHLNGRDHADDLTQDTFSRAIAGLHRFRADSDVRSWLLAIARRVCADQVRGAVRRRNLLGRLRPTPEGYEPAGGIEMWDVIGHLDHDRREAFVLTQVLGLSYDEAARVCGCPIGTIRSRVARARADLIGQLEAGEATGSG